jgi:hypothetical protein
MPVGPGGTGLPGRTAERHSARPSSPADLLTAWTVVRAEFVEHDAPSTLLGVAVLGYNDQFVEVEAIAAVAS